MLKTVSSPSTPVSYTHLDVYKRQVNLLSKQMVPANMIYFAALFNHFEPEHTLYTAGAVSMKRNYLIPMSVISKEYAAEETTYHGGSLCSRIKQPIKEE